MQTTSAAADEAPPRRELWVTVSRLLYAAPVVVVAGYGAWWIAAHTGGGRAATHTLWQTLTLTEVTVALLLRGRKPVGALAGILAAYLIFDLPWLTLPPLLFMLLTVAAIRDRRTAAIATAVVAAVIAAGPHLQRDPASFAGYSLPLLAAAGVVVAAGMYARARMAGPAGTSRPWRPVAALLTGPAALGAADPVAASAPPTRGCGGSC